VSPRRQTIGGSAAVEGTGLHLGRPCTLSFHPAPAGQGVVFERSDRPGTPRIPARVEHAVATERRTQLGAGDDGLHTVEHVLAAVAGLQVDDVTIRMDAPEPPIGDGSARPFVEALARCGVVALDAAASELVVRTPFRWADGDSTYEAHPAPALEVDVAITFPHPAIGTQAGAWRVSPECFTRELAGARTFGFLHEVEALRAKGLIQGASTANAIVLDAAGVVDTTLRWPDEFVRHKALDCVGDLALAGRRVRARVRAERPSHRGTVTFVRALLAHVAQEESRVLEIEDIMKVLPHRYPFLLVDRILERSEKRVVGVKNVTINEPFFQGHFPGHPVMPGVLIVEAMAQVGGVLLLSGIDDPASKVAYFMSLDNVKFRRPVRPGAQLICELELEQVRSRVCRMKGVAKVDGQVVCEAEMTAMVRDK
jgi:UDP-3-O-[3-hydroxymyristoyl] N-acetylglucosamine deacetylase/3-hydroxyacyl-[acyl-carrier-protein] dehydratase